MVASQRKNYTSLCAAQYDIKLNRLDNKPSNFNHITGHLNPTQNGLNPTDRFNSKTERFNPTADGFNQKVDHIYQNGSLESIEVDNKIDADIYNVYEDNFRSVYRRRKFGKYSLKSNAFLWILNILKTCAVNLILSDHGPMTPCH